MSPMVRTLLLVPMLAAGLAAGAPATAGADPKPKGTNSALGNPPVTTPATPPAHGRPVALQTGRRPR